MTARAAALEYGGRGDVAGATTKARAMRGCVGLAGHSSLVIVAAPHAAATEYDEVLSVLPFPSQTPDTSSELTCLLLLKKSVVVGPKVDFSLRLSIGDSGIKHISHHGSRASISDWPVRLQIELANG